MNTFKCASKINPVVNTIAKKNPINLDFNFETRCCSLGWSREKSVTSLPDNLGNGIGAGTERKM